MIKVYIGMLLVNIGCKKHSQAGTFLQPTPANIHQDQFNNPIKLYSKKFQNKL